MNIKQFISADIRRELQHKRRQFRDLLHGSYHNLAGVSSHEFSQSVISVQQEIKGTSFVQNKINNIRLSAKLVEKITIHPNEVFSFWKAVGKPSEKRGFKTGRTLSNGEIVPDIGGGLCQLSGIIYHSALRAGMEIVERHNHSVDLYKESERFTPLGSDATVAFGYKDLRFRNCTNSSIAFTFTISDKHITCKIVSEKVIPTRVISFVRMEEDHHIYVTSIDTESREKLAHSFYKKLP